MELDGGWDAHPETDVGGDVEAADGTTGPDLSITVDGVVHDHAATTDLDGDGVADTVHVDAGPDDPTAGSYDYTDTTGDGVADTLTEYDAHGGVVGQATFDAASGQWREVAAGDLHEMRAEPGAAPASAGVDTAPDATGAAPSSIVVDGPGGPADAGVASYDTTGDGVADTAVATTDDGSTVVVTDVDGDGRADYVTEVGHDGTYTSFEHTGGAEWTVVDSGTLGVDDPGTAAPTGSGRPAPGTPPG
ncbi:DUF6802 family protein [Rhodococcus aerolatus]